MVFLNPGLLLGLIAASIPVLIHLLNLRKLKRIEFSTLSFLKELQKTKIRRIKLKQWILLVLRTLIILFIVLSFARPTIKSLSLAGVSSAAKTTAVFILDNSFSMSAITEQGSYFNLAKKQINIALENLKEGDEAILLLTSEIGENKKNPVTNLSGLKKDIEETELSFISGSLNGQISNGFNILSESKNYNKELYVFSDFQLSRQTDIPGEKPDTLEYPSDNVRMYMFNLGGKDIVNYSISDFRVTNQIFEQNKPIGFTATMTNNSDRNVKNLVASLFLDGERIAQKSADLDPGQSQILQFETTLKKSGLLEYFIEIEDDEILQDNRRFAAISVPEKISLLFITENQDDSKYVETALMDSQGNNHIIITRKNLREITAINLDNFDAVIIIGSGNSGDFSRLQNYIKNGGQLILMPGSNSTASDFRMLTEVLDLPEPSVSGGFQNRQIQFSEF